MRVEMLEFAIFLIFFTLITILSIIIVRLKNVNLQLVIAIDQAIADIEVLSLRSNETPTEKEHLLSFLNETRDIAYKYIDEVHTALLEYKEEIEYDLNNPSELSIHRLKNAFKKLEKIYPKDIPND
jgi:hypothetical protein